MDSSSASQPHNADESPRRRTGLLLLLVLLPALLPLWLVTSYGVNMPYWDEWAVEVPALFAYAEGTFGSAELFQQQNDSRMAFGHLVWIALAGLSDHDVRYQMAVSVVVVCLAVLALHVLLRQTTAASRTRRLVLLGFASLLLFGLPQQQNWLWPIQFVVFTVPACLIGALAAAGSRWPGWTRALACALLCTIATFSFSNGVTLWLLVPAALFWPTPGASRTGWLAIGGFAAAAVAVLAFYFHGYEPQGRWGDEEASGPLAIVHFVLSFLGAHLGQGVWPARDLASTLFGAVMFVLLVAALGYVFRRRDAGLARAALPWALLAAFAGGSGTAAGLMRQMPVPERYLSTSVHFVVALVVLCWIVLEDARGRGARWPRLGRVALGAGLVAMLVLQLLVSWTAYWRMRTMRVRRLQGKAALAWILVVPEPDLLGFTVSPYLDKLPRRADRLDRLGWLDPPLFREDRAPATDQDGEVAGALLAADWDGDELVVSATARLTGRDEPADVVLLTREDADGRSRVFALLWERVPEGEAARYREAGAAPRVERFVRRLPAERVPKGEWSLSAWAYDAITGVAHPLDGALPMTHR